MRCPSNPPIDSDVIVQAARYCAETLFRRGLFRRSDLDDVQQDLVLAILKRLQRFDPDRASLPTFANRVAQNAAKSLLRRRHAAKRGRSRVLQSLEAELNDRHGAPCCAGNLVAETQLETRCGIRRRSAREQSDLKIDLNDAKTALPDVDRDLCRLLEEQSPTDVAGRAGIARSTVYRRMAKVRRHFRQRDLDDYL